MVKIRKVKLEDLPELVMIENLCFRKEEAATRDAFQKRIQYISDSFLVAEVEGVIVGLINGPVIEKPYITDDLFSEIKVNPALGGHQSVLGLAVSPDFQKRGIAAALLSHLENEAQLHKRESVTLTCKEELIGFYENHGYVNKGISSSNHGGVIWYNMLKNLSNS
ncbi:GNAT family N-acetyltransferase [Bacillus sp. BRMEA1]|uniref:GNAT family N-acetyltransferase n=1 Tax=Neobacillus endophyticus TaxID=2738405 RepID=UPI0015650C91|nr:N-acetyltransferase [Neobacillus endophyticus]NRD79746.1 GNAT family N-acetyltransferase [Neobacillus endophyticus]